MRYHLLKTCGAVLAGIAGLTVAAIDSPAVQAEDGGRRGLRAAADDTKYATEHQSVMRLSERDGLPLHRGVKLGRNKSMLVEMPRELRDVIVSSPDIVDAVVQSSNRVYLIGKKLGQANAFFFDSNGEQIATFEIAVEQDTGMLDSLYKRLLPGSNIKTEMLNETVILTGSVRNPSDATRAFDIASRFIVSPNGEADTRAAKKVINLLQVEAEEQVMLKVTVAEVERSVLKQFGINIGTQLNLGNFSTSVMSANAFPITAANGLGSALTPFGDLSKAFGSGCNVVGDTAPGQANSFSTSGMAGIWQGGNSCVSQGIKALERNGLIKTLAEPNLTAISGESAKFLAGGEFPVPVGVSNGQVGISFKEFGVSVAFTPIVMSEGRINLKIDAVVSELTTNGSITIAGIGLPALKKREAKSTVELPSGGTLAMAGLISEDTRKNIDGLPGIKDLPILGTLFRSQDFMKNETELVILVTPYVARPSSARLMARPTDGLAPASDLKSNLLGHMHRVYGNNVPPSAEGSLKDGKIGFIVE